MRQSFIIGAIFLFIVINILGNIADQQALLAQTDSNTGYTQRGTLEQLMKPSITDSGITTFIDKIGDVAILLGKTITLWHPALWQGSGIYIYLLFFVPIGISFWVVLVLTLRGVGSS
jgi:hypothetical protein